MQLRSITRENGRCYRITMSADDLGTPREFRLRVETSQGVDVITWEPEFGKCVDTSSAMLLFEAIRAFDRVVDVEPVGA